MQSTKHHPTTRLMQTTDASKPFTKDLKDLFATLMVSLKLGLNRVRFSRVDYSFTIEQAIANLGSLKFTQSARMPDPKNPSRIITTTSTTTFSMGKEMARRLLTDFVQARFMEPLNGTVGHLSRNTVCQLTPKGIALLQIFCNRNGITAPHVMRVLKSSRNRVTLLSLERDVETDRVVTDRPTVEVIFRRFAGTDRPKIRPASSDSDSIKGSESHDGIVGVKFSRDTGLDGKKYTYTFHGRSAVDWLMDSCTTIDEREAHLICKEFIECGLITRIQHEERFNNPASGATTGFFQPTSQSIYTFTDRGLKVCGWAVASDKNSEEEKANSMIGVSFCGADVSNKARLDYILADPSLRLQFGEFLCASFCEENLSFYRDVSDFVNKYNGLKASGELQKKSKTQEFLATAYGLYNAFLAPGSPCELNIDHSLRNRLASKMTNIGADEEKFSHHLSDVVDLLELAQAAVFKLMACDSVPKFFRMPKYAAVLQEHEFDTISVSRSSSPSGASK
ncbi:putative developmental regulator flbA [Talaromyces proteolyticus]|uniref:Developmental regulator flbA n=1 Tax=Talaromyces proteolyticus TaxID=1131652 RepID=A0AAD4KZF8_9EURO|nr:putative developmental regulator flbA [Talaromyces proteolyticus]KAH8700109.1 putative developmental regulator flbA [Talaromyces proteolyticus]